MKSKKSDDCAKSYQSPRGFTLVEVLVAASILSITIVGMSQVFLYSATLGQATGNITQAINALQNKMEEIRNYDFGSLTTDYAPGGTPGNTFSLTNLNGTGTITISQFAGPNLLEVQINANWQNTNRRAYSTTLRSLIAKR